MRTREGIAGESFKLFSSEYRKYDFKVSFPTSLLHNCVVSSHPEVLSKVTIEQTVLFSECEVQGKKVRKQKAEQRRDFC